VDEKLNVGLVGCGNISPRYVEGCRRFPILNVVACADSDSARAQALAARFPDLQARAVDDLLAGADVDIVVNLTPPAVHAEVSLAAIAAGKHVYSEKPLALTRDQGRGILQAAAEAGVRLGCAPDTFLGGGLQTARKVIEDGWIGEPVGATLFMMNAGPERWHPNPGFFYQVGAGPLFDMGPYYLTALIHLLGPVARVTSIARKTYAERMATSEALMGQKFPVEVPTYVAGVLQAETGPVATLVTTFDGWYSRTPQIEIYGSQGTLVAPDPNRFDGEVQVRRAGDEAWHTIPLSHSPDVMRGIGVADMAYGIAAGRPHRANGQMAYHVLDLMHALLEAAEEGEQRQIESDCQQPAPLPMGLLPGRLDSA
jgi:predicted dehydrogenase